LRNRIGDPARLAMLQITERKIIGLAPNNLAQLREEFADRHCIVLPKLFTPALLKEILQQVEVARFYSNRHLDHRQREFASDLTVRENELALHLIHFLLNNPELFQIIQRITDCQEIGCFGGRIYRSLPGEVHQLDWHEDTDTRGRLLGISINLSAGHYAGGLFQLREKESRRIVCEVGSGSPGDAHVFRISPQLQHRVTGVEGEVARTTAAGWFLSAPDRGTVLRGLASSNGGA